VSVLVGTTLAAYVMDQQDTWSAWLRNAEAMRNSYDDVVDFFTAIEVDARGLAPFAPLLARLHDVAGSYWTWCLDDGREEVTTTNRLRHITVGQNLVNDRACEGSYSHMLFVAADCEPPTDVLPKLIEVGMPIVAAHSPTYNLPWRSVEVGEFGNRLAALPVWTSVTPDVLVFSAACVMLEREAFRKLRWRWDRDAGMTDDPCLQYDAWYDHRWPTLVRHDVVTKHYPEMIPAIEHRGHDRTVVR
jgi:hypothetical protein